MESENQNQEPTKVEEPAQAETTPTPTAPTEPKKSFQPKSVKLPKIKMGPLIFIVVGLLIGIGLSFALGLGGSSDDGGMIVDQDIAVDNAIDYITTNFLEPIGLTAEVISVTERTGDYYVEFNVLQDGILLQPGEAFISKDGNRAIFGAEYDLTAPLEIPELVELEEPVEEEITEEPVEEKGTEENIVEFEMESFTEIIDEEYFPQFSMKEITVQKGDLVKISINTTSGTHDFKIDEFDVFSETPTGEVTVIEFVAEDAGEFEYYCTKPGHREAGHWGTLIVTDTAEA